MELTGAVYLYTDNNDFFNGNRREQDPLLHPPNSPRLYLSPGALGSSGCRYGYGGESTVSGEEKNDRKENLAWALSFGYPITRQLGVKVAYLRLRSPRIDWSGF